MAHRELKQRAIDLRKKGMSYAEIQAALGVSKSTLSNWLYDMPLSEARIRELRADSPMRIERYRNTMRKKREEKERQAYDLMSKEIGELSDREIFIAGIFLYWAEGTKTASGSTVMTNTNPDMMALYVHWLLSCGVPKDRMRIKLHLYSDMDIECQKQFWSERLDIPLEQFYKTYVKAACLDGLSYRNGFGQGTCSVIVNDTCFLERVLAGIRYLENLYK